MQKAYASAMTPLKILLVDDYEPFLRAVSSVVQRKTGFEVFEALDGLEAVQKAKELQPDLILLDIGLPKLNGIEAAIRIRTIVPHTKLLFVTQESQFRSHTRSFSLGGKGLCS
jgi:CheY-like chemotaxis protein